MAFRLGPTLIISETEEVWLLGVLGVLQLGLLPTLVKVAHLTLKLGCFEWHHLLLWEVLGHEIVRFHREYGVLDLSLLKLVHLLLIEGTHGAWILLVISVGIHWRYLI